MTGNASRPPAGHDGTIFGYLDVRISGAEVWTTGRDHPGRCLGPLAGARAGVAEPRRSRFGATISRILLLGDTLPKNARLYVEFADGSRHERLVLPWVRGDWPKIAGELGRFNAAARLAPGGAYPDRPGGWPATS